MHAVPAAGISWPVPVLLASRLRDPLQDDAGPGPPGCVERPEIFIRSCFMHRPWPAMLSVNGPFRLPGSAGAQPVPGREGPVAAARPAMAAGDGGRCRVGRRAGSDVADGFRLVAGWSVFELAACQCREGSWSWNLTVSDATGSSVLTTANISSSMISVTCGQFGRRGSSRATACSDSMSR